MNDGGAWLGTYRSALRRAGFAYQLQFRLVPRTGQPLHLVFGTGSDAGLEAMEEAMWKVDDRDGESFQDPRTRGAQPVGQLDLFQAVLGTAPSSGRRTHGPSKGGRARSVLYLVEQE
ncbi:hypothetical protein GCM10010423_70110 [Streptomyces levis]|uniref:Uncharacterized protein n=1 Tax=Streptomyces levis TaxID=285566 RepID=A0ABN3P7V4_9ACTN